MDANIRTNIDELIGHLRDSGVNIEDPVSKLMITALEYQAQKIRDEIKELPSEILERLSATFIPRNKIEAMPALCYVQPMQKSKKGMDSHTLIDGSVYTFKIDTKLTLSYYPLYKNTLIPYKGLYVLTPKALNCNGTITSLEIPRNGKVWIGLELSADLESLEGFSFYIRGANGLVPQGIYVDGGAREISFSTSDNLSEIPMMEPFDSQQLNPAFMEVFRNMKNQMRSIGDGRLIYVTEKLRDRDAFRCRAFPKSFQQILESADLDKFGENTLWILLDFGEEFDVPPDMEIVPNVVPAINVNINSVSLTQSAPIAKLTKGDGSYFLNVMETSLHAQKQGFNSVEDEVMIRDFDVSCYDPGRLHKDVRALYNRFIDDYHAFVDYQGLKDGELIRSLRELVNKIGKSVNGPQEIKNRFDEGTYAMRKVGVTGSTAAMKVAYLTTFGREGNAPRAGMMMENKKDAAVEKDVKVIAGAVGGEDKATADQRYEMLRYYTLTSDRLYTKMDIDAFLRLQLLKEFGKEEVKRISYDIAIRGVGGSDRIVRGLYVHIRFKDSKNYQKALATSLDRKLHRMIDEKSCISMPIIVKIMTME